MLKTELSPRDQRDFGLLVAQEIFGEDKWFDMPDIGRVLISDRTSLRYSDVTDKDLQEHPEIAPSVLAWRAEHT